MSEKDQSGCGLLKSKTGLMLLVFGVISGFFLLSEHQAHLWAWLPYLFLLACPLMHIFMHRGHGGHGTHSHQNVGSSAAEAVGEPGNIEASRQDQLQRDRS